MIDNLWINQYNISNMRGAALGFTVLGGTGHPAGSILAKNYRGRVDLQPPGPTL